MQICQVRCRSAGFAKRAISSGASNCSGASNTLAYSYDKVDNLTQQNAVQASERSLTLATNRYRGGVTSYLEVITAQSAALANERAAVSILARRMSATVLLLKGLGGSWTAAQMPVVTGK